MLAAKAAMVSRRNQACSGRARFLRRISKSSSSALPRIPVSELFSSWRKRLLGLLSILRRRLRFPHECAHLIELPVRCLGYGVAVTKDLVSDTREAFYGVSQSVRLASQQAESEAEFLTLTDNTSPRDGVSTVPLSCQSDSRKKFGREKGWAMPIREL
jgi:hypothetical protein